MERYENDIDPISACGRDRFGLTYIYPYQRLVISNILAAREDDEERNHRRQIVLLPTGAGKSLCFQLPAALLPGATCVVYPLLSLMNDQERRITDAGFSVVQLRGGQSKDERTEITTAIGTGAVDFILTNPETLAGASVRTTLAAATITHIVIDEAHCISEWGDTFREAYLTLGDSIDAIAPPIVTAFTATASERVVSRIREVVFPSTGAHLIRGNADRQNITYSVVPTANKRHAIRHLAGRTCRSFVAPRTPATQDSVDGETGTHDQDLLPVWRAGDPLPVPAIIFCRTRSDTESYAAIVAHTIGAARTFYYHAGLTRDSKKEVENRFFASNDGVLCATCAYGMGVDKPNIRTVVHTYIPDTIEAYLQESGRGGRDRDPSWAIALVGLEELATTERLRREGARQPVADAFFGSACRRAALLRGLGQDDTACTGCDRCAYPLQPPISPTTEIVLTAIESTPGALSQEVWFRILRGCLTQGDRLGGYAAFRWTGLLADWTFAEVETLFESLCNTGLLRRRGKNRLTVVRRRPGRGRRDPHQPFRSFRIATDS